jgi:predicted nucleic acid-binding protein
VIGYLDTSAFVPIMLAAEATSPACVEFWLTADTVVSTRLLYVETASALARGERNGRLVGDQHDRAFTRFERLFGEIELIDVDDLLVHRAAELARRFGLRGYDAVHCAAAALFDAPDLVAASGDRKLLAAWRELGIATFDPAAPARPAPTRPA